MNTTSSHSSTPEMIAGIIFILWVFIVPIVAGAYIYITHDKDVERAYEQACLHPFGFGCNDDPGL